MKERLKVCDPMNVRRIEYMDIFRGIGIILMIMGHIWFGQIFDTFKAAFHMPMFFIISGFFFKHKSKEELSTFEFILKKAKTLLVPYLIFGIFHFLIYYFILGNHDFKPLFHLLSWNNNGLAIAGALWFLSALFIANVIYFIIDRFVHNIYIKLIIILLIAVFGNYLELLHPPFSLSAAFVGVGLMHIGFLLNRFQFTKEISFLLNLKILPFLALSAITVFLIFVNQHVNMRLGIYSNPLLFWFNATAATVLGINLSKKIEAVFSDTILCKFLIEIGEYSIVFVCLNQLVIQVLSKSVDGILLNKLLILSFSLLILFILSRFIFKTNLRFIVGKSIKFKDLIY